jgi:CRISPR/Cas system-associated exonuclease Cas4 (RecB family)
MCKTQALVTRIGKILLEPDGFPDKILCLAYTNEEAIDLRHQLLAALGPVAGKLNIRTFESLSETIVKEYFDPEIRPLSPLERIRLFQKLIDRRPKDHPLKNFRGDVYFEISPLQHLFATMKREGWTPAFVYDKIEEYLAGLPAGAGGTGEEKDRMDRLKAAAGEFEPFRQLMRDHHRYDPDDKIDWAVRAFKERPTLSMSYKERFPYILVNAGEDMGGPQRRLVRQLTGHWGPSHVLVTGEGEMTLPVINGSPDLFSNPLAQKLLQLLRYLAAERDTLYGGDELLFEILHFDFWGIDPVEIARLSAEVADRQFGEQRTSIRRLLYEKANQPPKDLFDTGFPEGMKRASSTLEKLIAVVPGLSLSGLLDSCLRDTGLLAFIMASPEKDRLTEAVTKLSEFIEEETRQMPDLDLELWVQLVQLMRMNKGRYHLPDTLASAGGVLTAEEVRSSGGLPAPEIKAIREPFIDRRLEKFVMNVTALNSYLRCPLEFYFHQMVRIPSPKNEAAEFGSAVHHAMQRIFEKMKEHAAEKFPAREELLADFHWHMLRYRGSFTSESFARRLEYGEEILSNYYDHYLGRWNRIVAVERSIRHVNVKGVPLKGKLDKLEFQGREVTVVDYKTGDPDKAMERLIPPNARYPNGGDYWRQAVFYKILVDNYVQKDWKVVGTEFDFIEPDKKKEYRKAKVVITPEDITTVTHQLVDTWEKIQRRDFYTGCGKPDCHWCNFVKTNNLAIALHERKEEGA